MKGAPYTACERVSWLDVAPETRGTMFALRLIVKPGSCQSKIDYMRIPGCKLMYAVLRRTGDGCEYYCPDEERGEFDKLPLDWLVSPDYVPKAESSIVVFVRPAPGLTEATAEFHSPYLFCSTHYEINCGLDAPIATASERGQQRRGKRDTIGGIGIL